MLYDGRTGLLLSGENFDPGRIYIADVRKLNGKPARAAYAGFPGTSGTDPAWYFRPKFRLKFAPDFLDRLSA